MNTPGHLPNCPPPFVIPMFIHYCLACRQSLCPPVGYHVPRPSFIWFHVIPLALPFIIGMACLLHHYIHFTMSSSIGLLLANTYHHLSTCLPDDMLRVTVSRPRRWRCMICHVIRRASTRAHPAPVCSIQVRRRRHNGTSLFCSTTMKMSSHLMPTGASPSRVTG